MEKKTNNPAITKSYAKKMETISPFELKNKLIDMADESIKKIAHTMLNAGRGNPNWIATEPREAFFLLGQFGLCECRHAFSLEEGIAGIPQKAGIAARFEAFLKENEKAPGANLLKEGYNYMLMEHAADPDTLIHEWAESVIGDQYPVPDRILHFTELIVQDYLAQEMCDRRPPKGTFDLFATEGGTAAMCYLFDSLQENFLLNQGDAIALMVPVFTPYIEIPELRRYQFDVTEISADQMTPDGLHTWQYKDEDIDKLKDPRIKALFITNPSNPPSYALSKETTERIINIVKNDNPNLMIITDDVYGTFIPHFRSLMAELPHNTLCVYSFSKYFGATGWRTAVIALHEDNIYDKMIARLSEEQKSILNKRYSSLSLQPEKMKFINRMVADSRQIALNHTAGLSLPHLPGPAAEKGGAGRHRGRAEHRRILPQARDGRHHLRQRAHVDRDPGPDRPANSEGDPLPPGLFAERGSVLPDPEPAGRHPLRRREPAHPAGHADRLVPHGRAVYSGRAVHRPAPAGQRHAAGDPQAPAGSGQHPDRRGARRGYDAGRGLYHRHRPQGRGPRRRSGGRRDGGGDHGCAGVHHRPVPLRSQKHPRPRPAAGGQRPQHGDPRRSGEQSRRAGRDLPPGDLHLRHRRVRVGQVLPRQ